MPEEKNGGTIALVVQNKSGKEQNIIFDQRPLHDQIRAVCEEFGLLYDNEDQYYVLTEGLGPSSAVVRSEGQLLEVPHRVKLGLRRGVDLVEERLNGLRGASQQDMLSQVRALLACFSGEAWLAEEVIDRDGIRLLLRAASTNDTATELACACLCELFQYSKALSWLEENQNDLTSALFRRLFATVFVKKGRPQHLQPRATLCLSLFLLYMFPDSAMVAHNAAKGAGSDESFYPRIVGAIDGEGKDEFQSAAAINIVSAMGVAAGGNRQLVSQVRHEVVNRSCNPNDGEELFSACLREDHFIERLLATSMGMCTELTHAGARVKGPDGVDKAGDVVEQLERRVRQLQELNDNMKDQLRQRHNIMCKMVHFTRIENSPVVEQSLDGIVRCGWESVHWRHNYNLMHYVAQSEDDPSVVELVGLLATDIDQRDDHGNRPIDYARQAKRTGVIKVIEKLRREMVKRSRRTQVGGTTTKEQRQETEPTESSKAFDELQKLKGLTPPLQQAIEAVVKDGWENVNWPSNFTAIHLAARCGHVEALSLLAESKGDVSACDDWKLTPMDYAAQGGHEEIIECLQRNIQERQAARPAPKARVQLAVPTKPTVIGGGDGHAVAHVATQKMLVPPGLRPELQKACEAVVRKGWSGITWPHDFTALHLAARLGSAEAVSFLLDASAMPGLALKDDKQQTPIDYARRKEHTEVIALLEAAATRQSTSSMAGGQVGHSGSFADGQVGHSVSLAGGQGGHSMGLAAGGAAGVPGPAKPSDLLLRQGTGELGGFGPGRFQRAVAELMMRHKLAAGDTCVEDMGLIQLRSEVTRLRQQRTDSAGQATGGPGGGNWGPLDEDALKRYFVHLQTFGAPAVLAKLTDSQIAGGLALNDADAKRALAQLELVQRVSDGKAAEEGTDKDKGKSETDADKQAGGKGGKAKGPGPKGDKGGAPGGKGPPPPGGKGPPPPGGKGPPPPGGKGPPPPGGKGPPPPGGKGPQAPGGKPAGKAAGKGKAGKGAGGKGGDDSLTKKRIVPNKPMKPLWWTRYLFGVQLKKGETVWDEVADDMELLPIEPLEARFSKNAVAVKEKANKGEDGEQKEEIKLLRIITDPNMVAGREASLKQLPPVQEVARALEDLDDMALTADMLKVVKDNAIPNPAQMKQLVEAREKQPNVPMALPEQYMWVLGNIPAYQQRLDCWSFVRTYDERQSSYKSALDDFENIVDCFLQSEMLPSFLGIILATGNYLNGGTDRGQADGFDFETLGKLDGVRDATGKDLRHYIFDVFFNQHFEKASALMEELSPCFMNVNRRITKDSDGTEKLSKGSRINFEDFDACVSALKGELEDKHETMQMVLQYFEDPADQFKLRMPGEFSRAKEQVDGLVLSKERVKDKYGKLLTWFKIAGMKSGDFCLSWDNLLIPSDMITNKPEKVKKEVLIPVYCRNKPISAEDIMVLWEYKVYSEKKATGEKSAVAARRAPKRAAGRGRGGARPKTADVKGDEEADKGEKKDGATTVGDEAPKSVEGGAVPAPAVADQPSGQKSAPPKGKGVPAKGPKGKGKAKAAAGETAA